MSYASKQDMIERFGEAELIAVTDRVNGASINDAVLQSALDDADALINSYLKARYQLPLTPAPRALVQAAAKLARYQLHEDGASEQVSRDRDMTIAWLKDVARGVAYLGEDLAAEKPASPSSPQVLAPERIFTEARLKDFLGEF